MQSKAQTVEAYLAEQTPERRAELESIRRLLRESMDPRIAEGMSYGMISYWVPFEVYPHGYHCDPDKPLPFACLASQKQHLSLHLLAMYMDPELAEGFVRDWLAAGKKLDMGKSCIRFKRSEDLALDVLRKHLKAMQLDKFVAGYAERYGPSAQKAAKSRGAAQGAKQAKDTSQPSSTKKSKAPQTAQGAPGKPATPLVGQAKAKAKSAQATKTSAVAKARSSAKAAAGTTTRSAARATSANKATSAAKARSNDKSGSVTKPKATAKPKTTADRRSRK